MQVTRQMNSPIEPLRHVQFCLHHDTETNMSDTQRHVCLPSSMIPFPIPVKGIEWRRQPRAGAAAFKAPVHAGNVNPFMGQKDLTAQIRFPPTL